MFDSSGESGPPCGTPCSLAIKLTARRGPANRLYIPFPPQVEQQCRRLVTESIHLPSYCTSCSPDFGAIVTSLHRAASQRLEGEGDIVAAIRHAQAARDLPQASRLLADHHLDLDLEGRSDTISELLKAFQDEVAAVDAELALVFATALLLDQELAGSESRLDLARRLSHAVPPDRRWCFELVLAVLRLVVARWRGDLETVRDAMRLAEAALEALPAGERALTDDFRAVAFENLGVAELWCSRFDDARRHLEQARALARRAGRPWLELPISVTSQSSARGPGSPSRRGSTSARRR
jgi:ATP/maltotriose-dependent transcriptional regulator MalT